MHRITRTEPWGEVGGWEYCCRCLEVLYTNVSPSDNWTAVCSVLVTNSPSPNPKGEKLFVHCKNKHTTKSRTNCPNVIIRPVANLGPNKLSQLVHQILAHFGQPFLWHLSPSNLLSSSTLASHLLPLHAGLLGWQLQTPTKSCDSWSHIFLVHVDPGRMPTMDCLVMGYPVCDDCSSPALAECLPVFSYTNR
jgi:hypothetical protein